MLMCESGKREERSDELIERCEDRKTINSRNGDEREQAKRTESRGEKGGKRKVEVRRPVLVHNISSSRSGHSHPTNFLNFFFLGP